MNEYLFTNTDLMIYSVALVLLGLAVGGILTTLLWESIIAPLDNKE